MDTKEKPNKHMFGFSFSSYSVSMTKRLKAMLNFIYNVQEAPFQKLEFL